MRRCPHRGFPINDDGSCDYHGFCYPRDLNKFSDSLVADGQRWEEITLDDYGALFHRVTMAVEAPWYLWMQNTCDFLHLKTVHKNFSSMFDDEPYDIGFSEDGSRSSHRIKVNERTHRRYQRHVKNPIPNHFLHSIQFPYWSYTSFMNCFYSREQVVPGESAGSCVVDTTFFTSRTNKLPEYFTDLAIEANEKILAEDKQIVERWAPTATVTGNWFPEEARIRAFVEHMKEHQ